MTLSEELMPKHAVASLESAEVLRELQQSEAMLKHGTPGLEALNLGGISWWQLGGSLQGFTCLLINSNKLGAQVRWYSYVNDLLDSHFRPTRSAFSFCREI